MAREPEPGVRRNPKTVTDTCFPSIDRIADDTTLSDKTVRRALGYLVQWGLITKSILPHHKPMIGRHPEKYYGRRYHVGAEVWDAAESEAAVPTVEMAQPSPEDLATLDRLDDPIVRTSTSPVPVPTVVAPVTRQCLTAVQQRMFTEIAALLRERLGSHPTYKHKDAGKIMSRCINDCLFPVPMEEAWFSTAFKALLASPGFVEKCQDSKFLGGYLKTSFQNFAKPRRMNDALIRQLTRYVAVPHSAGELFTVEEYREYVGSRLGEDLVRFEEAMEDGTRYIRVCATGRYTVSFALNQHTGSHYTVQQTDYFKSWPYRAVAHMVAHALRTEPWSTGLKDASDPLVYLKQHATDVDRHCHGKSTPLIKCAPVDLDEPF